jgi:HK97 family phage prohead protease
MLRYNADASLITAEAGDEKSPPRIAGIAVPWDVVATVSDGTQVQFSRGAFDVAQKPAKLIENHDMTQLRGVVNALADTPGGLEFEATLADTRASRDAVALLKAGAYDSVSVGAKPIKFTTSPEGVMTVTEAVLAELSLVAQPAFEGAVITQVAATAADPDPDEESEPETNDEGEPEVSDASEATPVEAAATIPTHPILYAEPKAPFVMPTPAEYIAAMFGDPVKLEAMNAGIAAAAPDVITTDTPGVLPTPILAPVYNNFIGMRPVVDAIGAKAMPGGGKVFIRPEVTTHTSMAVQSAENAALQSGTFVVSSNQVTKATYGGYVTISEQDLDWTDPNILSLVLDDMTRIYANQTDDVAADALVAGATTTRVLSAANLSDPAKWVEWVYGASSTILSGSNGNLPTHLFVSPDVWAKLGQLVDSSNRPLFPQIGPMNAYGTMSPGVDSAVAFGLRVVVDRNFASGTAIIGDPSGFEIFEQQKGALSIDNPSTISRTIAFRGYFATLMIDSDKFVKRVAS